MSTQGSHCEPPANEIIEPLTIIQAETALRGKAIVFQSRFPLLASACKFSSGNRVWVKPRERNIKKKKSAKVAPRRFGVPFKSSKINNMCSPYLDVSETGRFSKLGSTFPVYNVIKAGNAVMFSICSSVITNKPDISSLSDALPLDRWWSIRCELTSSLQLFKATKSVNPLKLKIKKRKSISFDASHFFRLI